MRDHSASHTFICKWNEPYLPLLHPQPHSIIALWLVLISHPADGRRLSWPGWLGEILRWFARPKTVTRPSICHGGQELNPLTVESRVQHPNHYTTKPPEQARRSQVFKSIEQQQQ